MGKPKFSEYVDGVRWYRNPNRHDGKLVYRSVTAVLGAIAKPALVQWSANMAADYALENIEMLKTLPRAEARKLIARAHLKDRDGGAARGGAIHDGIEAIFKGQPTQEPPSATPYLESFRALMAELRPDPELIETTVYDEKHLTAGSLDYLGRFKAAPALGRCCVDWKSSKGLYPDMKAQVVGGYALGADYYITEDGQEHEWKAPDTCAIVHIGAEGAALYPLKLDVAHRRAFLAALELTKWEDGQKFGRPLKVEPAQQAFEAADLSFERNALRTIMQTLEPGDRAALAELWQECGLPHPSKLDSLGLDQARALLNLVSMREKGLDDA
jgi:hypothetical protein